MEQSDDAYYGGLIEGKTSLPAKSACIIKGIVCSSSCVDSLWFNGWWEGFSNQFFNGKRDRNLYLLSILLWEAVNGSWLGEMVEDLTDLTSSTLQRFMKEAWCKWEALFLHLWWFSGEGGGNQNKSRPRLWAPVSGRYGRFLFSSISPPKRVHFPISSNAKSLLELTVDACGLRTWCKVWCHQGNLPRARVKLWWDQIKS